MSVLYVLADVAATEVWGCDTDASSACTTRLHIRLMPWLQLQFDYGMTTTLRSDYNVSCTPSSIWRDSTRARNKHVNFCHSRIAVESNAYRNFSHLRWMRCGIIMS